MKIEMALTARRTALTLAVAGALLGFAAPAASAAQVQDGPSYVIDGPGTTNGNGPTAFIVDGDGSREPVFFCEADKPEKRHMICVQPVAANGPRF